MKTTLFANDSIFNVYVSVYNGVKDTTGTYTLLSNFLSSVRHRDEILHLRTLPDKESRDAIKVSLPLATVSGAFSYPRSKATLQQHSGFICIDIDGKDNTQFAHIEEVYLLLTSRPEVAYAARSISGNGYFAIIPLLYPDFHEMQFDQLREDYKEIGINLDSSCRDVCRLRCVSYDEHPYINEQAEPYSGVYVQPDFTQEQEPPAPTCQREMDDLKKVERCCGKISEHGIDITGDYESWKSVGMALASLGENGRKYFHICSRQYAKYNYAETERKFTNLLRTTNRVNIGTFFFICRQYGITYSNKE
ncbi:PriCT-2 domain-containing protein [Bacteroides sp.]|uniref:BT4734/BF3469 family protein n=1 Tax=Bacteroides sp. TaxID=29523 RepID=UPI00260848E6|nr:PriCT-2 domain-containing protein [Bacteroides sp.]MDD3041013.1 BT4734/BF3469 family protein [Bacteroides sp.]